MLSAAGCATHVVPPVQPAHPVAIFLCDYGFHSSLLLPSGGDQYVEYNYGDWDYSAMNETDPWHTLVALFHSRQASFGRRFLRREPGESIPIPPNKPHTIQAFAADETKVRTLVDQLDLRYRSNIVSAYLNATPDYFFVFVKDSQHYSLENNCNTLTGCDLKLLGCQLDGRPIVSDFHVEAPLLAMRP